MYPRRIRRYRYTLEGMPCLEPSIRKFCSFWHNRLPQEQTVPIQVHKHMYHCYTIHWHRNLEGILSLNSLIL